MPAALDDARGFTIGVQLSLASRVEAGLRQDGDDIETGAGMDIGGGLVTNAATGLSLAVRTRSLVVHPATASPTAACRMSLGWDRTPSSPLGLAARVAFIGAGLGRCRDPV